MNKEGYVMYGGVAVSMILLASILTAPMSMTNSFTALQQLSVFNLFGSAEAANSPTVTFQATDKPGNWFDCSNAST